MTPQLPETPELSKPTKPRKVSNGKLWTIAGVVLTAITVVFPIGQQILSTRDRISKSEADISGIKTSLAEIHTQLNMIIANHLKNAVSIEATKKELKTNKLQIAATKQQVAETKQIVSNNTVALQEVGILDPAVLDVKKKIPPPE